MKKSNKFSPEVRERAVRMVQEHRGEYPSLWAAIEFIAPKIGFMPQTLNEWVNRVEVVTGVREGVTSAEARRVKELERENKELRRANEILKLASAFFCPGGARPPTQVLKDFVDKHRHTHGVEPICKVLQITPSGYRRHAAHQRNPDLRYARAKLDDTLKPEIQRVWQANMRVDGADKVYKQMRRERITVAHCTVERLMKCLGLQAGNGAVPESVPCFVSCD
jgi:putative transposase